MLTFYPRLIRSFTDLPGHTSLMIHSLNGCHLRCFGCHNYDALIQSPPDHFLSEEEVLQRIAQNGFLFDAVIISGGEFLMGNLSQIMAFLQRLKKGFNGKIIVNTNGAFPQKVRTLLEQHLVDGIHIDMKLPYHCLDVLEDREVYKAVLGVVPTRSLIGSMLTSIEEVIRHNSPDSQVRTVRYPILSDEYFTEIQNYVQSLKEKYDSDVPYHLNPYYQPPDRA